MTALLQMLCTLAAATAPAEAANERVRRLCADKLEVLQMVARRVAAPPTSSLAMLAENAFTQLSVVARYH